MVLFAGAGISTENPGLFPETFYEEIEARIRDVPSGHPFPEVMQAFEDRFGRADLLRTFIERLDYVGTFQSLTNRTTAFHREIATISQIDALFTTNWDDFFERFSAARSFVLDEDFAFFDIPGRRVMKLHGSVSNLSSIVATTEDYERRSSDLMLSVMGAKLRDYLSTKTIVFVGYSLSDSDFRSIYNTVLERMGRLRRRAYVVTPVDAPSAEEFGLTHIQTDGAFFAHLLKSRLDESGDHVPDERLDRSEWMHSVILGAHLASEQLVAAPGIFGAFTQSYQDGLLAALGRVRLLRNRGDYSDPVSVRTVVHDYAHLFIKAIGLRRYFDACYIEGYMLGTFSVLLDDEQVRQIPIVQVFGDPAYRASGTDPHRVFSEPWWMSGSGSGIGDYLREGDVLQQLPTEWLRSTALSGSQRARRSAGLTAEHKKILDSLVPGSVPQHSEFLDGVL
ncbi:SIR2 family protein [Microbacterium enclense]|uniref:SIR2 family protein n=1 Tax=Microbacterium enclense TaxID=993073 RepID=UPI00203F2008|nr:SIR2 family protein [Microbacterium enclense]MCM3612986.1 SIR2 family protein [Microbacterium enclense]